MSSGRVEVFSIRPVHPCHEFIERGLRCVLIPAGHARFYANLRLKPHNFLVPLPDQLTATEHHHGVRLSFQPLASGKAPALDPCRIIEGTCPVQQFHIDAANFDLFQIVTGDLPGISVTPARSFEFCNTTFHAALCIICFSFPVFWLRSPIPFGP